MRLNALESLAFGSFMDRLLDSGWQRAGQATDEPGLASFDREEVQDVAYQLDVLWDAVFGGIKFTLLLGVRHLEVSALVSRFMGYAETGRTATFGRSLIDLLPHISPIDVADRWLVRSEADVDSVTQRAAGDLDGYGLPFLRSFRNLDDVISYLENEDRYQMLSAHLAVACGIAGRQAQAEDALRDYANASQDQGGSMLRQSQDFLSNFVQHFGFGGEFVSRFH